MQPYTTVSGTASASITEKKSEFIANVSFVNTEEAALAFLQGIKAQHRTARHNVYAYQLREGNRQRYSDDGEPAKTAGLPTLECITHAGLTDVIVVVTRYFGGTLLGTGGLVRAYTAATQAALAAAQIVTVSVCVGVQFTVPYALYEQADKLCREAGAHMDAPQFAGEVTLSATLLAGAEAPLLQALQELTRGSAQVTVSAPYYAPF